MGMMRIFWPLVFLSLSSKYSLQDARTSSVRSVRLEYLFIKEGDIESGPTGAVEGGVGEGKLILDTGLR